MAGQNIKFDLSIGFQHVLMIYIQSRVCQKGYAISENDLNKPNSHPLVTVTLNQIFKNVVGIKSKNKSPFPYQSFVGHPQQPHAANWPLPPFCHHYCTAF